MLMRSSRIARRDGFYILLLPVAVSLLEPVRTGEFLKIGVLERDNLTSC